MLISIIPILVCTTPIRAIGRATLAEGQATPVLRIGFSSAVFGDVNKNDALAAVHVWAETMAKEQRINVNPQPLIFNNVDEISTALSNRSVECINITTAEYAMVKGQVSNKQIITGVVSDSSFVEYVLLVHSESGINDLVDLQGRSIILLQSARCSLVSQWLGILLARQQMKPAGIFFQNAKWESKIGKTILPVFFRKADACIVTRMGFETMIELNPQIGRQLKILTASPPVIPMIFCFRAGYDSPIRELFSNEISLWHTSKAGMQILTIFQTDRLDVNSASVLDGTMDLIAEHLQHWKRP